MEIAKTHLKPISRACRMRLTLTLFLLLSMTACSSLTGGLKDTLADIGILPSDVNDNPVVYEERKDIEIPQDTSISSLPKPEVPKRQDGSSYFETQIEKHNRLYGNDAKVVKNQNVTPWSTENEATSLVDGKTSKPSELSGVKHSTAQTSENNRTMTLSDPPLDYFNNAQLPNQAN